jgi:hypothetical protein
VPKAVPPVELDGLVVKTSFAADPALMVRFVLTALVSEVAVAVKV